MSIKHTLRYLAVAIALAFGFIATPWLAQECEVPPSGMIAWWPGDGHSHDLVAGRDAVLGSGATYAVGVVGQAFSIDGVDDTIQIPHDSPFDFSAGSTISIDAWIYPTRIVIPPGFSVYGGPIIAKGQDNGSRNWWFGIGGNNGLASVGFTYSGTSGTLQQYSTNSSPIQVGMWHHVAVSYTFGNASSANIFVNGQQVVGSWTSGTGNESPLLNNFLPRIGGEEDNRANDRFAGSIDEVEVFNRALSASEIQAVYVAGSAGKCKIPLADAGPDQTVDENVIVQLYGTNSLDPLGNPLTYSWTQVAGPALTLSDLSSPTPSFTAPSVAAGGETVTLQLVVSSTLGSSEPDPINVTIKNVNHRPVAETTGDLTVPEGFQVTLDGTPSFDVDDEPLTHAWNQTAGTLVALSGSTTATPGFMAPPVGSTGETLTFQLVVNDGIEDSAPAFVSVNVTNVNQAPTAHAGADFSANENTLEQLDASGSSDPDFDALTYNWTQISGTPVVLSDPSGVAPSFTTPFVTLGGEGFTFQLVVDDGQLVSVADEVMVFVLNSNDPPNCSLGAASPLLLWPPNHKLVPISISGVADPQGDAITVTVTGVTQDEATGGLGDGDTSPDAVIQGDSVLLRAERWDAGNGRVYAIGFTATDGFESCDGTVRVTVPKNMKKGSSAIDDGQNYNSLQP